MFELVLFWGGHQKFATLYYFGCQSTMTTVEVGEVLLLCLGKRFPFPKFPVEHGNNFFVRLSKVDVNAPLRESRRSKIFLFLTLRCAAVPKNANVESAVVLMALVNGYSQVGSRKESFIVGR